MRWPLALRSTLETNERIHAAALESQATRMRASHDRAIERLEIEMECEVRPYLERHMSARLDRDPLEDSLRYGLEISRDCIRDLEQSPESTRYSMVRQLALNMARRMIQELGRKYR